MTELPLLERAASHGDRVALRGDAETYSYAQLLAKSQAVAAALLGERDDLGESRVALFAPAGSDYVAGQWGIWAAGGVTTPLSLAATEKELEYALTDSGAERIAATHALTDKVASLAERSGLPIVVLDEIAEFPARPLPAADPSRRAMILYTSGTTSKPKGVVSTHACLQAQIESLIEAWRWTADDSIPLFLPLHHIHGIVNILSCALWSGALVEPFPRFDADAVLRRVADGAYTVFMAVPTIYFKLITALEAMPDAERRPVIDGFARMRLMVSGSAALPASVHQHWQELTGQALLERYGMTEIGMALSNPYDGERRPGAVGQPLPGVEVRLRSEQGGIVADENEPGEILVRGPSVFAKYWNRPEATRDAFRDGWFQTGDIAVVEDGYYRIMGRSSVDIIKSGGYKLSALEIEATLLEHPAIAECAVIGLPDDEWGEVVAAAVVLQNGGTLDADTLRAWCRERMSPYKTPRRIELVDRLPRNAMGKVTKPAVRALFGSDA